MTPLTASKGNRDAPESFVPDWSMVPFDVTCARCGHNLHGLTEPKCPACQLEFDWSEAVPLEHLLCPTCHYHLYGLRETRCPECGESFKWKAVVEDYRRSKKPLFEFQWRKRFFKSLWYSWKLSWRPWKLWRTVDIHDPPLIPGLLILLAITALVFVISLPIMAWGSNWLITWLYASPIRTIGSNMPGGVSLPLLPMPVAPLSFTSRNQLTLSYQQFAPWAFGLSWYPAYLTDVVVWALAGVLALLVLRQSMALCEIRNGHVLRVYVYSIIPLSAAHIVFCLIVTVLDFLMAPLNPPPTSIPFAVSHHGRDLFELLMVLVPFLFWLLTTISIALAYKHYIRMRHAWGVALVSQLIAVMFSLCVMLLPILWRDPVFWRGWWADRLPMN